MYKYKNHYAEMLNLSKNVCNSYKSIKVDHLSQQEKHVKWNLAHCMFVKGHFLIFSKKIEKSQFFVFLNFVTFRTYFKS